MGNTTTVTTVGLAAGLATVVLWLLGAYAPDLMANAPAGLEAAITGIFAAGVGYIKEAQE